MTIHEIRANGSVTVSLANPDDNADWGEMHVQDIRLDETSYHCICGAQFENSTEAIEHFEETEAWKR